MNKNDKFMLKGHLFTVTEVRLQTGLPTLEFVNIYDLLLLMKFIIAHKY